MGMGYAGGSATTISTETLKKVCPKEYENLDSILDASQINGLDGFAQILRDEDKIGPKIEKAFDQLIKAFNDKTGLKLSLLYHDPENGDLYDELQGHYWDVDNVYQLTPQAQKFIETYGPIEHQNFVEYG